MIDNKDFVKHHLNGVELPQSIKRDVYKKYFYQEKDRTVIADKISKASELSASLFKAVYNPTSSEALLEIYAKRQSREIEQRSSWGDTGCMAVAGYLKRSGLKDLFPMRSAENEAEENEGFIYTDGPTIKRLTSDRWMLRQMRKKSFREVEQIALNYGLVHGNNKGQRYVSDATFRAMQTRKQRNNMLMSSIIAINEEGQEFTLAELSDLSVSNPEIRNKELMMRMRGTDEYAIEHKHFACMWTITAPSKYHPSSHKWGGYTPRETQKYLSNVWAKFRAWAKRNGHNIYGFRVAEPHKDGCPHWHIAVIFENEETKNICSDEMYRFALEVDGDEAGAKKRRFDCVDIDRTKGSLIGYIAKYITKNIDGKHINDIDGRDPLHAALRVQAWASVWGIRQFQPFGQPSVSVWRELRRVDDEQIAGLEDCREAADSGDWAAYIEAQGGHTILYKDRPVKPFYQGDFDSRINDIKLNEYGEPMAAKIMGLSYCGRCILTRLHTWTITDRPEALRAELFEDVFDLPWTCVNNCTGGNEDNNFDNGGNLENTNFLYDGVT